jgi:hypothetical protein
VRSGTVESEDVMLRRVIAGFVTPLFVLAAVGCGGGAGGESPVVEKPTLKVKSMAGDPAKPNEGGAKMKAD